VVSKDFGSSGIRAGFDVYFQSIDVTRSKTMSKSLINLRVEKNINRQI
jgi:hypothetical protein